ncbi:chromosome segregation protein SMC [Peribacillus alkalitolerans]|uniref:chromosome segregation protein SMC n=1 Tax=Peribacillus alkalitolerans TaxID=1550385 RepID=UPI0013D62066|nr:chromosome segregation protein SMC [Peribacillus alkalitolerans]
MFLKRLDVVGFKSFAERINIEFVPGVTAVVGPNGSGKSNVTDAIRWVLGEQSAKSLRGAKMEDIIFAGSDSRRALNFAEVTLTLDNEEHFLPIDYHEVSVTRRVYRSGDSEFYINKQACRLKDIIDLFMDSGLGREAFSIISQGKVEEILSSKSEERRSIFEEAAGVLKYKTRKKKAENKLFETQENLNRVQDILHELEGQVEPLKIQASIARDYLEQKEELEHSEVAVTVYEIETLHGKWTALSEELEKHKNLELEMSTTLGKREAIVEQHRDRISALDDSINELQEVLLITTQELEKLEGRKEVLKERKKNATQNKQSLEKSIEDANHQIEKLSSQKGEEEKHLNILQNEVAILQKQLDENVKQLSNFNQNIDETIETFKADYIEWLNKQAAAKNEYQLTEQQVSQLKVKSERLDTDNEKYINERKEVELRKQKKIVELTGNQKELENGVSQYRQDQLLLEKLENQYKKQESLLYQAFQFLQQTRSRKEMLEEMEEDYAGFFQGVKEVLRAREGKLSGIEGAVAELIQVPKEYELAIETALGAAMQHIIVGKEEDARKAIGYLKANSFGRATFLPLSVIKGREVPSHQLQQMKSHPSFNGIASSLISYENKISEVMANLLGTVVITSDLKGANELARLTGHKFRFVTIDGDVVNPGGSMSGGAVNKKNNSLLSRKSELDEIKDKLAIMEKKTATLEEEVKAHKKEWQQQTEKLESKRSNGEQLRMQEQTIKGDLREIELLEKNVNERLALYDLDKSSLEEELAQKSNRLQSLKQLLQDCDEELSRLNQEIAALTLQKETQQISKEAVSAQVNEWRIQLASKKEQLQNQKEKHQRIQDELNSNKTKLTDLDEDLSLLDTDMSDSSNGEAILEESARKKLQDKNETLSLISSRREERVKLHHLLEDEEREAKELKRQHKGLVGILKDEEVQLNRLDVELETRLEHLREEYFLSFEEAKEKYELHVPIEEARKKVKLIKLAIEELGTVNIGAIDEYERVSERYSFLSEQKTDLQDAKDTLHQVIDEMDEEMKRRFAETFFAIKEKFGIVFQSLFGGGRAELKLTDPQDMLNTGVDIVAQPPGKKLQNLGLLSGGERALTAIALLFSILQVRPVPFCVLDEVEAALDEANVHRFSQFLKKFSSETQFIVITHRKGTMEAADVLYGITMQESGVSKLVSVRLDSVQEIAETK